MRLAERVANWLAPPAPFRPATRGRSGGARGPVAFSINVPPEMTELIAGEGATVQRVSRRLAITVPAVKRGRDLIAGTLGTLPFRVLDPRFRPQPWELLRQPEDDLARSVTMTRTFEDMLFEGRCWYRITAFRSDGWPAQVRRLDSQSVTVRENQRVYVSREGTTQGSAMQWVPDDLLIRVDSPNDPLLEAGARAIRAYLALSRATTRNVEEGVPLGYLTPTGEIEPDDPDEVMSDWADTLQRRSWPYMPAALKAEVLQWDPEKLQLNAAKEAAIVELAQCMGIDPEEFGISTTTRTYANAEQRRLDLIDFTCAAYVTAFEDRMSMDDVTPPGWQVTADYSGFLRSDTLTRLSVYEKGRAVGTHDDQRISEIEKIPLARVKAQVAVSTPAPVLPPGDSGAQDRGQTRTNEEEPVSNALAPAGVQFSAVEADLRFAYNEVPEVAAAFKADSVRRTISGMALPWNVVARSGGYKWAFAPGSLHWSDTGRVKLDKDHGYGTEFGRAVTLTSAQDGLLSSFKVARGASGDDALGLAEDGVYDGLSVYVNFESEGDGWIPHPDDETVRYVQSATLRKVALTAMPAFDDARVQHVAATRNGAPMQCTTCGKEHAPNVACTATTPPVATPPVVPATPAQFDAAAFAEHFTAGLTASLVEANKAMLAELIQNLPAPQRQVVPAGRLQSVVEPLVYQMNGQGPSFVRDARRVMTGSDGDGMARARLRKFEAQTTDLLDASMADPSFAVSTGNAAAVIPPGYRPDLYVSQLLKGRPLTNAISRGTIADATPFTVPAFVSATGATADHVEGVNPGEGSLSVGPVTITPGGISGLYKITREMADSANPAIDAIATQAMSESFSQQSEAKVYAELNGTNGVGGTITAGFVPSGAQATTTTGAAADGTSGRALLAGVRQALGIYDFRRFAEIDFGFLSQEGVSTFAGALDTTGRPLVPWVNSMNPMGTMVQRGYDVDGTVLQKAWSMSGNAAGDADMIAGNRNDVWCWESPVLTFRFEERSGPAFVELALFGYFAVRILRPVGLVGIRHTVT